MNSIGVAMIRIAEIGSLTVLTIWAYSHGHETLGFWAALALIIRIAYPEVRST